MSALFFGMGQHKKGRHTAQKGQTHSTKRADTQHKKGRHTAQKGQTRSTKRADTQHKKGRHTAQKGQKHSTKRADTQVCPYDPTALLIFVAQ